MGKPSDGNAIALAGVAVGAACVFATLGAIANIWGNPWADIAFVLTVTGMGLAVANAFGVPIHGRVKATARQGPGRDTRTGDGAGPGGGTGLPAHSEETGPGPSHDYGNRRAGQPDEALRPVAAERAARWIRPDIDASLPLLEECLELRLAGGDLLSRRVTRGERQDETRTALPSQEMVEEYRQARRKAMRYAGSCDEQAMSHVRRLSASLQQVLMQAVPEAARRRLAAADPGRARQLAALELRLLDRQLERYPWELLADPEVLRTSAAGITVWRRTLSPPRPEYRSWTGNLLLTGTPSALRRAPAAEDELTWIKGDLDRCAGLRVFLRPGIPVSFEPLMAEHPPAAFHLVTHETSLPPRSGGAALRGPSALPGLTVPALTKARTWLAVFSSRTRPPCRQAAADLPATRSPMHRGRR